MSKKLLEGKVALITGGATGIGQATALLFADYGAKVAIADVNEQGGAATADKIRGAGGDAAFFRADVSVARDVEALISAVVSRFGGLHCAFNNAGIDGAMGQTHACTEENWQRVIGINLSGVFYCMKYEIAYMLEHGGGAIVNTASVAGLVGVGLGLPAYVAAKHGVVGLTRAAALEYATKKIRVNAVCPGAIRTPMLEDAIKQGLASEEMMASFQPMGRLGEGREIGEAAAWLCSDASSFATGLAMNVDGGYVAQ